MRADVATFSVGQTVYHKVDEDPGIVTAVCFRDSGVSYEVTWMGRVRDWHGGIELSAERVFVGGAGDEGAGT